VSGKPSSFPGALVSWPRDCRAGGDHGPQDILPLFGLVEILSTLTIPSTLFKGDRLMAASSQTPPSPADTFYNAMLAGWTLKIKTVQDPSSTCQGNLDRCAFCYKFKRNVYCTCSIPTVNSLFFLTTIESYRPVQNAGARIFIFRSQKKILIKYKLPVL